MVLYRFTLRKKSYRQRGNGHICPTRADQRLPRTFLFVTLRLTNDRKESLYLKWEMSYLSIKDS
ncbi:hypothetical protein BC792_10798 [Sphingobacterium allocomposti]|uniref:Uncharacterized protein n=1 Tax=Sphingobacterium allocomposti TaxID=415956 RepID=A0A5S5DND1_9SPHI|nr:hypothetical protein BC792_10798 [Sphingobacterium composti Yoo et al. 2007 non Ten et al. 2007]